MEMRKQGGGEGQGTARSASKAPAGGRKQTGEASSPTTEQEKSGNQGATENQGASMKPSGSANQGMNQGASAKKGTSPNQGGTGQQMQGEQDLLQHAKNATGEIVNKVQERAGSQFSQQKETAASQLSQVANAVRRLRENLPEQEGGAIGRYVADYGDKAANSIERLSNYIREQDPKQLLNDVQNFGRRRPALLVGGAFLLGFAGARLIRSSMEAGSQQQSHRGNVQTTSFSSTNVRASKPSTNPSGL